MTNISDAQKSFRNEIASDLNTLAVLHDHEPQAELIENLRKVPVDDWFGMRLSCGDSVGGREVISAALGAFSTPVSQVECDELAVDFANIYLIHTYRAPPTESPWLDKDGLERQGPMFAIAEYYRRNGLEALNRQKRSDDHLVLQLQFLSHLVGNFENPAGLKEAARFMDEHILKWFGGFAERVAARCQTPYYAGLVTLTNGYLEDLREQLVILAEMPRPEPGVETADTLSCEELEMDVQRYVPGVAPSW